MTTLRYPALIEFYAAEGAVLGRRSGRVRNALAHGDPAGFAIVEPVREDAEFLSNGGLDLALRP
ncbi:hypothetical protein [Streptomyces sp. NPDC014894]|uniref:hypothetical protein n=1 Tax=Streptomyces sp. NPDC014894 TaxID=3364931 RepID=UPI0037033F7D